MAILKINILTIIARNFGAKIDKLFFTTKLNTMKRKLSTVEESNYSSAESENSPPRRITRYSSILLSTNQISKKPKLDKDEKPKKISLPISKCPFIEFNGQIEYYSRSADITTACEKLLIWLNTFNNNDEIEHIPVAFDMEWPFNFKTGPGKSSVIQLCADEKICYVFSIGELDKLPTILIELLLYPKLLLHGVNIKNDFRKLQRDFPAVNSDLLVAKCLDLAAMCNDIKNTTGRWSLEKLVNKICRLRIDKSNKIRMSKWNVVPLDESQLKYAAIDVYIGQVIYRKLEEIKLDKAEKAKIKENKKLGAYNIEENKTEEVAK